MEDRPRLVRPCSGEEFILEDGEQTLGRSKSCDIYIPDGSLSKTHAWVVWRDRELLVRDAGSRNGIFVAGKQVEEAVVKNGDTVCFGKVHLEVAGLPELRRGDYVKATKAFDGVAKAPVHEERHLRKIRQAVARTNADQGILEYSKKHLIRDHKNRFPTIRDNLTLPAKWLPEAHADRQLALKHLTVVKKRIRAWKMK